MTERPEFNYPDFYSGPQENDKGEIQELYGRVVGEGYLSDGKFFQIWLEYESEPYQGEDYYDLSPEEIGEKYPVKPTGVKILIYHQGKSGQRQQIDLDMDQFELLEEHLAQ